MNLNFIQTITHKTKVYRDDLYGKRKLKVFKNKKNKRPMILHERPLIHEVSRNTAKYKSRPF